MKYPLSQSNNQTLYLDCGLYVKPFQLRPGIACSMYVLFIRIDSNKYTSVNLNPCMLQIYFKTLQACRCAG